MNLNQKTKIQKKLDDSGSVSGENRVKNNKPELFKHVKGVFKLIIEHMSVNLGSADIAMTKSFRNKFDVFGVPVQISGESVTEAMDSHFLSNAGPVEPFNKTAVHLSYCDSCSPVGQKKCLTICYNASSFSKMLF